MRVFEPLFCELLLWIQSFQNYKHRLQKIEIIKLLSLFKASINIISRFYSCNFLQMRCRILWNLVFLPCKLVYSIYKIPKFFKSTELSISWPSFSVLPTLFEWILINHIGLPVSIEMHGNCLCICVWL